MVASLGAFWRFLSGSGGGSGSSLLNKLDATSAPTVNDDSDDGYAVGSMWIDVSADEAYRCLDATVGAAVWVNTTVADALGTMSVQDANAVAITGGDVSATSINPLVTVISGTTHTLASTDAGKVHVFSNAAGCTVTVPLNAADAMSGGDIFPMVAAGAGGVTVSGSAVTGGTIPYLSEGLLRNLGADTWEEQYPTQLNSNATRSSVTEFFDIGYWQPAATNGCGGASATNLGSAIDMRRQAFTNASDTYDIMQWRVPDDYDGTSDFNFYVWANLNATSGTATWRLEGKALTNDEDGSTTYGTASTVQMTASATATDILKSNVITISRANLNNPVAGDLLFLRLSRDTSDSAIAGSILFGGLEMQRGVA